MPFTLRLLDKRLSEKDVGVLCKVFDDELREASRQKRDFMIEGKLYFKYEDHETVFRRIEKDPAEGREICDYTCYDEMREVPDDLLTYITSKLKKIRDRET